MIGESYYKTQILESERNQEKYLGQIVDHLSYLREEVERGHVDVVVLPPEILALVGKDADSQTCSPDS